MTKNNEHEQSHCSRRAFLSAALAAPVFVASLPLTVRANDVKVSSPNGKVEFQLAANPRLVSYRVTFKNNPVIDSSRLGIIIDDLDLGQNAEVGKVETYRIDEQYPSRGVHSHALNRCKGAKIRVRHSGSATNYTIEVRTFNDGIAFRHIVPGDSKVRIPDEASAFVIPA